MADVKITKKMVLTAIARYIGEDTEIVESVDGVDISGADVQKFVATQLEQLEAKATKAKERAGEKKAAGDELRGKVKAVLTGEFQTRDQVFAKMEQTEDLTIAKVGARLTQLVASGEVVKEQVKSGDHKVMGYKLAGEVVEDTDEVVE